MQYVNDDMDELFRRAAEDYPLDTNSADWNKVLAAMQGQEATKLPETKGNKNGRFLWLLLLLPLGWICYQLYPSGDLSNKGSNKEVVTAVQKQEDNHKRQAAQKNNPNTVPDNSGSHQVNSSITKEVNSAISPERTATKAPLQSSTVFSNKNLPSRSSSSVSEKKFSKGNSSGSEPGLDNTFPSGQKEKDPSAADELLTGAPSAGRTYLSSIFFERLSKEIPATLINRELSPIKNPFENEANKSQTGRNKNRFYVALVGEVDATTVKFQKIKDAGFTYGLLIGKELNKKWSLEAGYFVAKKYYYSEGKYFNTSKIGMPPNASISDVTGKCKMIEVPLSVKYNFAFRKNSNWLATLGSSSYFMKKENYTYNYYYGTYGPVPHSKEYKNSSTNWFSNITISAGYEHKLGDLSSIRVEPYVKMPLSGMGIGKLPLFSTGLQVGLVKKF